MALTWKGLDPDAFFKRATRLVFDVNPTQFFKPDLAMIVLMSDFDF